MAWNKNILRLGQILQRSYKDKECMTEADKGHEFKRQLGSDNSWPLSER